jgi:hypothetical protein
MNAVQDFALNNNTAASAVTPSVHVDTIAPTIVSISAPPTTEQNVPFDLLITFSEGVEGFAADDVTVTGPATASWAGGLPQDATYRVTITPNLISEGDVTVQVNANAVQDFALNANTAASAVTPSVHIDTIVPTVTISAPPTPEQNAPFVLTITFSEPVNGFAVPADASAVTPSVHIDTIVPTVTISAPPTPEQNAPFVLTITFSEPVNGFAVPADLTVTGPATASLTSGSAAASVYTVTITPNLISEGDVTVQVNANTVQDFARNNNTASNLPSNTFCACRHHRPDDCLD